MSRSVVSDLRVLADQFRAIGPLRGGLQRYRRAAWRCRWAEPVGGGQDPSADRRFLRSAKTSTMPVNGPMNPQFAVMLAAFWGVRRWPTRVASNAVPMVGGRPDLAARWGAVRSVAGRFGNHHRFGPTERWRPDPTRAERLATNVAAAPSGRLLDRPGYRSRHLFRRPGQRPRGRQDAVAAKVPDLRRRRRDGRRMPRSQRRCAPLRPPGAVTWSCPGRLGPPAVKSAPLSAGRQPRRWPPGWSPAYLSASHSSASWRNFPPASRASCPARPSRWRCPFVVMAHAIAQVPAGAARRRRPSLSLRPE